MISVGLLLALLQAPGPARLISAGGWGPEGHHASLERDVDLLRDILAPPVTILFGRGDDLPTVQTATAVDPLHQRLALVFNRPDGLGVTYRPPRHLGDEGARPRTFLRAVRAAAQGPEGAVIFGAGHGSPARGDETAAALELWGGPIDVPTLAQALDGVVGGGTLTFVLGQCHSGAFADLVHRGGDPSAPLAEPVRCVLAAAPAELEAAGCSPDASEGGFLRYIVRALNEGVDYDRDGRTGLDEALAFARIHDPTVDVPVRSSEVWLSGQEKVELAGADGVQLRADADPAERAVLRSLGGDTPPAAMAARLDAQVKEGQRLDDLLTKADERFETARRAAEDEVLARWPVLLHPFHPEARALLGSGAPGFGRWWSQSEHARALEAADAAREALVDQRWMIERALARTDRWLRVARSVVGRTRARGSRLAVLNRLRACEARAVPLTRRGREALQKPR